MRLSAYASPRPIATQTCTCLQLLACWPLSASRVRKPVIVYLKRIIFASVGLQQCREDVPTEEEHPSRKQGAATCQAAFCVCEDVICCVKERCTPSHSQGLTLKRHIEATLGSGNIREAVRLPPGEDLCEWLAVNTVDFYNALSVLYGTLEEFCTKQSCPVMTAGPKVYRLLRVCFQCTEVLHGRQPCGADVTRRALTSAWCRSTSICGQTAAPGSLCAYQRQSTSTPSSTGLNCRCMSCDVRALFVYLHGDRIGHR